MTHDELLHLFRQSGALLEGHFRLSSGLHSPGYMQSALVLQHPRDAAALGEALGPALAGYGATAVLSPHSAASSSAMRWRARSACARSSPSGRTAR